MENLDGSVMAAGTVSPSANPLEYKFSWFLNFPSPRLRCFSIHGSSKDDFKFRNSGVLICYCFSTGLTCLRFCLRETGLRGLNRSEYAIIVSQFIFTAFVAGSLVTIAYLMNENSVPDFIELAQLGFAARLLYLMTVWSIKLSVNLLCLDLSRDHVSNIHRNSIYTLVYVVCSFIVVVVLSFVCWPPGGNFAIQSCDPDFARRTFCATFALHITSDLLIFILPFPLIRSFANRQLRNALFGIFGLGILAAVMGSLEFALLLKFYNSQNTITLLSTLECSLCMSVASLPGMAKPLTRYFRKRGNTLNQTLPQSFISPVSDISDLNQGAITTKNSTRKSSASPSQDVMQSPAASDGTQIFSGTAHN